MKAFWSLFVFVLWLVSFPLEGFLLEGGFLYFLFFHIVGLFFLGIYLPGKSFTRFAYGAVGATAVLTVFYPLSSSKGLTMALTGFAGSFTSLLVALRLKHYVTRVDLKKLWVIGGIAAGNFGAFLLGNFPLEKNLKFLLLSLLLSTLLIDPDEIPEETRERLHPADLLFLFFFYISGGILYGRVVPLTSELFNGALPMVEVLFYSFSAIVSLFILSQGERYVLILKVVAMLCMGTAFTLMHTNSPSLLFLSSSLIQAGFGFADVYTILLLLKYHNPLRSFGLGLGVMCSGIFMGAVLSEIEISNHFLSALGSFTLIVTAVSALVTRHSGIGEASFPDNGMGRILNRLSPREKEVFFLLSEGKSYREIADELGISVSSVREYIRRIEAKSKKEDVSFKTPKNSV